MTSSQLKKFKTQIQRISSQKIILTLLVSGVLSCFLQCSKASQEIPAYFNVDSAGTKDTRYGEPTSYIYGINIQIGKENRGRWNIPCQVPVLIYGNSTTYIAPIVKINNLSTNFIEYPLFKPINTMFTFTQGKSVDTSLTFEYYDDVNMVFYEDNETSHKFSNSAVVTNPTSVSNSNYGALSLRIDASLSNNDTSSLSVYYKPLAINASKLSYLEFDYYMPNGVFTPVLIYIDSNQKTKTIYSENYLLPNSKWTHVYWHLTPLIRQNPQAEYSIGFVITPRSNENDAVAYIDNIKILEK